MTPPTRQQLEARIKKMQARIGKLEEDLAIDKSTYKIGDFGPTLKMSTQRLDAIDKILRSITAQGAVFAKGGVLNTSIEDIAFAFDKFAGNAELGNNAIKSLVTSFEQFSLLAGMGGEGMERLTTQLAKQAGTLDRLGLSLGDYTKNLDTAMNMFALTEKQVKGINRSIVTFAEDMEMLPSVVSRNFQLVAQSLAYEAPKVLDQFKKLQRLSQETGVAMPSLMSGFGERLDTISGASSFAGQLNAILGGNYITPNELFAMDEAERAVRIRQILQSHRIYDEIKSGSRLGKFATATAAKIVGYDRSEMRKFILGKAGDGSLKGDLIEKREGAMGGPVSGRTTQKDITREDADLTKAGDTRTLEEAFKRDTKLMQRVYLGASDQAKVLERQKRYMGADTAYQVDITGDSLKAARQDFVYQFKSVDPTGISEIDAMFPSSYWPSGTTSDKKLTAISTALRRAPQLFKILALLQTLPNTEDSRSFREQAYSVVKKLAGETVDAATATAGREELMKLEKASGDDIKSAMTDPFRKEDDEIDFDERAQLKSLPSNLIGSGYYRQLIRKFRAKGGTSREELKEIEKEIQELSQAPGAPKSAAAPTPKAKKGGLAVKTLVPKKGAKPPAAEATLTAAQIGQMASSIGTAVFSALKKLGQTGTTLPVEMK